jgi:uncharacterized protein
LHLISRSEAKEQHMGILTEDMQRVVNEQRLAYVATVGPDGSPNLSPKGTLAVWDDEHLIFADIRSPQTIANLQQYPAIEVNVVDPIKRKGYRFKGTARVVEEGLLFDAVLTFYRNRGVVNPIRAIVVIAVKRALPLISPDYDLGLSEDEVSQQWRNYRSELEKGDPGTAPGE